MYTRKEFGKELKQIIINKKTTEQIGGWVYWIYMKHIQDIDSEFRGLLLDLSTMEDGPEFALSYERLNDIADRLIAGESVKLYP